MKREFWSSLLSKTTLIWRLFVENSINTLKLGNWDYPFSQIKEIQEVELHILKVVNNNANVMPSKVNFFNKTHCTNCKHLLLPALVQRKKDLKNMYDGFYTEYWKEDGIIITIVYWVNSLYYVCIVNDQNVVHFAHNKYNLQLSH